MSAIKLRKKILEESMPIIEHYIATAKGEDGPLHKNYGTRSEEKMKAIWDAVIPIIQKADDPVPLAKLTDGDISERVDAILSQVAVGEITPDEGKRLIALLQAGFDITELPKLIEAIEKAEAG